MNIMVVKYTDLINWRIVKIVKKTQICTFGEKLLENRHVPYEGLVIETSNAQHGMFSFKTQPL